MPRPLLWCGFLRTGVGSGRRSNSSRGCVAGFVPNSPAAQDSRLINAPEPIRIIRRDGLDKGDIGHARDDSMRQTCEQHAEAVAHVPPLTCAQG
jgi:hypothetical protein